MGYCKVALSPVRKENRDSAEMVSQLLFGELFEVQEVQDNWTQIQTYFDHYNGWIDTKHLVYLSEKEAQRWLDGLSMSTAQVANLQTPWGPQALLRASYIPFGSTSDFSIGKDKFQLLSNPLESFKSREDFALAYLNTPYLWGGKGPFGIDCSGFMQSVFRFSDIQLPRDAYQQEELGLNIDFEDRQPGDMAFFANASGKVTHVGLLLSDLRIIHASGWVRIDSLLATGIWNEDLQKETHRLHSIKRI